MEHIILMEKSFLTKNECELLLKYKDALYSYLVTYTVDYVIAHMD